MSKLFSQGQITGVGAVLIAAITMVGGVFSARLTANSTINEKIAEVKTETRVVAGQVTTNESNTKDRLNRLEDKIDWLIRQQGGIPTQIISPTVPGTTIKSTQ